MPNQQQHPQSWTQQQISAVLKLYWAPIIDDCNGMGNESVATQQIYWNPLRLRSKCTAGESVAIRRDIQQHFGKLGMISTCHKNGNLQDPRIWLTAFYIYIMVHFVAFWFRNLRWISRCASASQSSTHEQRFEGCSSKRHETRTLNTQEIKLCKHNCLKGLCHYIAWKQLGSHAANQTSHLYRD